MTEPLQLTDEVLRLLQSVWHTGISNPSLKAFDPTVVCHVLAQHFKMASLTTVRETSLAIGFGKGDRDNRHEKMVGSFHAIWPGVVLFRHEYYKAKPVCSGMVVRLHTSESRFEIQPFASVSGQSDVSIAPPKIGRMEHTSPYGPDCKAALVWSCGPYIEGSIGIVADRWEKQKAWLEKWLPIPG